MPEQRVEPFGQQTLWRNAITRPTHHRDLCFGAASVQPRFATACVGLKHLIAQPLTLAALGALPFLAKKDVFIRNTVTSLDIIGFLAIFIRNIPASCYGLI